MLFIVSYGNGLDWNTNERSVFFLCYSLTVFPFLFILPYFVQFLKDFITNMSDTMAMIAVTIIPQNNADDIPPMNGNNMMLTIRNKLIMPTSIACLSVNSFTLFARLFL